MKKVFRPIILLAILTQSIITYGQYPLPYNTGWDNTAEKIGWDQFRTGDEHPFDWGYSNGTLSHDYPVGGTALDTVRDWFVSPLLSLNEGGILSISASVNTPFSDVSPADHFGIWFSTGDRDPTMGDYQLIADLTNWETENEWRDTMDILIPATGEDGYIAFLYQATNNWFTISFDNLEIVKDTLSAISSVYIPTGISVYPNPVKFGSQVFFEYDGPENNELNVSFFDIQGRLIVSKNLHSNSVSTQGITSKGLIFYMLKSSDTTLKWGKIFLK